MYQVKQWLPQGAEWEYVSLNQRNEEENVIPQKAFLYWLVLILLNDWIKPLLFDF